MLDLDNNPLTDVGFFVILVVFLFGVAPYIEAHISNAAIHVFPGQKWEA